jgi:hypothetical protein
MDWLQDLMRAEGLEPQNSANAGLRSKLLSQADRMLNVISKYKSEDELDGAGSKFWWAPQSVDGQRRVVMRAGSKTVDGSAIYVNNTLDDVKSAIEKMRTVIDHSKDAQWADEEERRKKK